MAAFVTALATSFVALDSSSLVGRGWWTPPPSLVYWSVAVVGAAVLWQFIDAEIERRRVKRRTELANEIKNVVFPVWYKVRTVANDRRTQERIGVHVWMVPTWHWNLVPDVVRNWCPESWRAALPTPRMWRACHFRLKDDQHDSTDIRWTRDVGAIGRCWRTRRRTHFVTSDEWGAAELDATQWSALPPEQQFGLTYPQYLRIREKYHSVLVLPIYKHPRVPGSRFIGCVAVDALVSHPVDLDARKVRAKAFKVAEEIASRVVPIAS